MVFVLKAVSTLLVSLKKAPPENSKFLLKKSSLYLPILYNPERLYTYKIELN